jgi:hypothetical protein
MLTVVLNLTILAGYALLIYAWSLRHSEFLDIIRDWFPLPLVLLAYREIGWFAAPHITFRLENIFIRWDRALLRDWGIHRAIESLGPVLPSILEIAYMLTYALAPFAMAMIYVYRRRLRAEWFDPSPRRRARRPFAPPEPRAGLSGRDLPSMITVFRRFNWWMLGGCGVPTSVFPARMWRALSARRSPCLPHCRASLGGTLTAANCHPDRGGGDVAGITIADAVAGL